MRREGFELGVSRPEVIQKEHRRRDLNEPYEHLVIDCEAVHQGAVMEELGIRRAELSAAEHSMGLTGCALSSSYPPAA